MGTTTDIQKGIDEALAELEQLAGEARVKLHLGAMDARDAWETKFEPRLVDARRHAREATTASKAAIDDALKAVREFAHSL